MSLIRKHGAVLQAWACLDLVYLTNQLANQQFVLINQSINHSFDSGTRPINTHIIHRDSKHKKLRNCTLKT